MTTNWIPILWNLGDARGELASLVARVQQAAFGDVYDEELKHLEDFASSENRERPLTEGRLLLSMDYVYKHLNRTWNGRNAPMETVDRRERCAWAVRKPRLGRGRKVPTLATIRRKDWFPRVFPF